jgi:hypothetical protein
MTADNVRGVRSLLITAAICGYAFTGAPAPVRLQPEERTTLRVGQVAALDVKQPEDVAGSAGASLVLVKRATRKGVRTYLYRAVRAGDHTLLVVPTNRRDGDCISCVTVHYFVTVVR